MVGSLTDARWRRISAYADAMYRRARAHHVQLFMEDRRLHAALQGRYPLPSNGSRRSGVG